MVLKNTPMKKQSTRTYQICIHFGLRDCSVTFCNGSNYLILKLILNVILHLIDINWAIIKKTLNYLINIKLAKAKLEFKASQDLIRLIIN